MSGVFPGLFSRWWDRGATDGGPLTSTIEASIVEIGPPRTKLRDVLLFICPGGGAPEEPSKLPDEPPDKSPLQSGQRSLPTDGEARSDESRPPPPDKSPAGSPDKSPVLPPKRGRPTDEKTRDDILASYRERPNLSREERAKISASAPRPCANGCAESSRRAGSSSNPVHLRLFGPSAHRPRAVLNQHPPPS